LCVSIVKIWVADVETAIKIFCMFVSFTIKMFVPMKCNMFEQILVQCAYELMYEHVAVCIQLYGACRIIPLGRR
jgi:hypothetical protein